MSIDLVTTDNNTLILAGHMAIANCEMGLVCRSGNKSVEDEPAIQALRALQDLYFEVMSQYLSPQHRAQLQMPQ